MGSCSLGGKCPFNDGFWYENGESARVATDNCPLQRYENCNHTNAEGVRVVSDRCKYFWDEAMKNVFDKYVVHGNVVRL